MVATAATPAEAERKGPAPATTTAEAKATKNPYLCLSSLKLTELSPGLEKLTSITNLDISNNPIASLPEGCLPPALVELTLTGCALTALPASLASLTRLKKLYAGANRLADADSAFKCPSLQHAGLAYNRICRLPVEALRRCPLLSLDLAHNDLEGLEATLGQLAMLPSLGALSLSGNPLSLCPRYAVDARATLRQLLFLDGQRLEVPANSRPGTTTMSTASSFAYHAGGGPPGASGASVLQALPDALARAAGGSLIAAGPGGPSGPSARSVLMSPGGGGGGGPGGGGGSVSPHGATGVHWGEPDEWGDDPECTAVVLELRGLRPGDEEPAFVAARERWAEQVANAEAGLGPVPPVLDVPEPPLQPVTYHVEMVDVEGVPVACVPLRVSPPTPPDVVALFDPKARAAAAAAALKDTKKPLSAQGKPSSPSIRQRAGKGVPVVEEEAPPPPPLEAGVLRIVLPLRANAEHRNWLRAGTSVTLYKTVRTAVPRPPTAPPAAEPSKPSTPSKQATRKKKGEEPPPIEYDITSSTAVLGTAMLRTGAQVVDGYSYEGFEMLDFKPPPALLDERTGVRLPLKDARHPTQVVARMEARVRLHVPPAGASGRS